MGSNLLNRVLDAFGLSDDENDILEDNNHSEDHLEVFEGSRDKKNKAVSVHSRINAKVVVCTIDSFDQVTKCCDYLKENKLLIIDFKKIDCDTAQRCIDFLGGAIYTMKGHIQEITPGMLLLAPSNTEVSGDIKDGLVDSGILSWVHKSNH